MIPHMKWWMYINKTWGGRSRSEGQSRCILHWGLSWDPGPEEWYGILIWKWDHWTQHVSSCVRTTCMTDELTCWVTLIVWPKHKNTLLWSRGTYDHITISGGRCKAKQGAACGWILHVSHKDAWLIISLSLKASTCSHYQQIHSNADMVWNESMYFHARARCMSNWTGSSWKLSRVGLVHWLERPCCLQFDLVKNIIDSYDTCLYAPKLVPREGQYL